MNTEQILLGSLLGDGCIHKDKLNRYAYREAHSLKQKDYLLWKNKYLNFNFRYIQNFWWINKGNKYFKYYYDLFYPNNKKIVTREILNKLGMLGLAIWFLDDGSYNYWNDNITIQTQSFGLEGNKIIQQYFKEKWDIDCKVQKINLKKDEMYINNKRVKHFKKQFYIIIINKENTKKFIKIIKSYILQIPSMIYKIGLDKSRSKKTKREKIQYYKEYYLKNKDKSLKYQKEYLNKPEVKKHRKEYYKKYDKIYWIKNKERLTLKHKNYFLKNKDKINKKRREKR